MAFRNVLPLRPNEGKSSGGVYSPATPEVLCERLVWVHRRTTYWHVICFQVRDETRIPSSPSHHRWNRRRHWYLWIRGINVSQKKCYATTESNMLDKIWLVSDYLAFSLTFLRFYEFPQVSSQSGLATVFHVMSRESHDVRGNLAKAREAGNYCQTTIATPCFPKGGGK